MTDIVIDSGMLRGGILLPEWLRHVAWDMEKTSIGPVIDDLRTLADEIERQL